MVLRTYRIKIKNAKLAKDLFQKWFFDYKFSYNKANWLMNSCSGDIHPKTYHYIYDNNSNYIDQESVLQNSFYSKLTLRDLITPEDVNYDNEWVLETPKDIRASAVFENRKNWSSAFTNLRNGNINHFHMGYMKKRKKKNRYCFGIPGSAISVLPSCTETKSYTNNNKIKIYSSYTNDFVFHLSKPIPDYAINYSSDKEHTDRFYKNHSLLREHKILFNGVNYYLLLTVDKPILLPENKRRKTVACDQGVRKFLTTWDINENSYMFGVNKRNQIFNLAKKMSKYQSKKKWKEFHKIKIKIYNLINELHHKTSTFLCKRYRNIIIPKLNVKELVKHAKSKIIKRSLLSMGLCGFINHLKTKGELYNTKIYSNNEGVHERYSSMQCSHCRYINVKDANEIKKCKNCLTVIDRDVSGGKNIYFYNIHLVD